MSKLLDDMWEAILADGINQAAELHALTEKEMENLVEFCTRRAATRSAAEVRMSELSDVVKCDKCENRGIVAGLCAGCASKELKRLRGIEAAVMNGETREEAVKRLRAMAREFFLRKDRAVLFAIADELEAK